MHWVDQVKPGLYVSVPPFPGPVTYPQFRGTKQEAKRACREAAKAATVAWLSRATPDVSWLHDLAEFIQTDPNLVELWTRRLTGHEPVPLYLMAMTLPNTWLKRTILMLGKKGLIQ